MGSSEAKSEAELGLQAVQSSGIAGHCVLTAAEQQLATEPELCSCLLLHSTVTYF